MLVVANETVVGETLLDRIRERAPAVAGELPDHQPAERPAAGRASGGRAPPAARAATLRSEGIDAHGQVTHPDPYTATLQVIADERVDEVLVSTFPGQRSGWLRRDLVERLRKDAGVPVEHVVVEPEQAAVAS